MKTLFLKLIIIAISKKSVFLVSFRRRQYLFLQKFRKNFKKKVRLWTVQNSVQVSDFLFFNDKMIFIGVLINFGKKNRDEIIC